MKTRRDDEEEGTEIAMANGWETTTDNGARTKIAHDFERVIADWPERVRVTLRATLRETMQRWPAEWMLTSRTWMFSVMARWSIDNVTKLEDEIERLNARLNALETKIVGGSDARS